MAKRRILFLPRNAIFGKKSVKGRDWVPSVAYCLRLLRGGGGGGRGGGVVARDGGEGDGCADKVPGATAQSTRNGPFHPDQNRK